MSTIDPSGFANVSIKISFVFFRTAFSKLEILIAWRYLISKRREGGISTIAWYSFLGVTLGVATLIVVQAVMVGFKEEFTDRIIGANPHLIIQKNGFSDENTLNGTLTVETSSGLAIFSDLSISSIGNGTLIASSQDYGNAHSADILVEAANSISGIIDTDTVWEASKSPYVVTGPVSVEEG